jgi:hypothetical protein
MKTALTAPPNPAKEKTTWGEVCHQVGFADNLYRTCRDKLGNGFQPATPFGADLGGAYDDDDGLNDADLGKAVRQNALPPPPPPPEDWEPEAEGFMEQLMSGELTTKLMLYGGGALLVWFLYDKYMSAPKTASAPAGTGALKLPQLPAQSAVAKALHIPAGQVSDTAPTTVSIPASLRR